MIDSERIAQLEADLAAAERRVSAMRLVAKLALAELVDVRELLESVLTDRANCTCQCTTGPTCVQRPD